MSYSDVFRTVCGVRPGSPTLALAVSESIPTGTGMLVLEVMSLFAGIYQGTCYSQN